MSIEAIIEQTRKANKLGMSYGQYMASLNPFKIRPPITLERFMCRLKTNRENLNRQQYKTLKGQAVSGDYIAANKGLEKLLNRMNNKYGR